MSRYFYSVLLFALFSFRANSQDVLNAYIIKPNGDSIPGTIKLHGDFFAKNVTQALRDYVAFNDGSGTFVDYKPEQLKGFGYYPKGSKIPERYASEKVSSDKSRFLVITIDGPLRLYTDKLLLRIDNKTTPWTEWYIKKAGAAPLFISNQLYYKPKKREPLKAYLSDCPELEDEYVGKGLDLNSMVNKYNSWYQKSKG